jgi:CBS domain containing-hemolysin-like protein
MNKQSGSEMKKKEGGSVRSRGRRRDAPPIVQPLVRFGLAVSVFAVVLMSSVRIFAAESGGHAFEDTLADILTWVVLIVAPIVLIGLFLILHILPEKIAERRRHPQLQAIKTLCFLSLVFGGLLWPLAWLWAFTKPVMYKMAYGTDVAEPEAGSEAGEAERKAA